MASKGLQGFSRSLKTLCALSAKDGLMQCLAPRLSRSMATEAPLPSNVAQQIDPAFLQSASGPVYDFEDSNVLATIYKFPTMEPLQFVDYSKKHLYLPLRRDILHRAVVFEGDFTRQGTASSKTRFEVHGSHKKVRPQKGTGNARLGTRQSPMLKGGGKSFGPHPRNFATLLPRKIYDLAWRTALSWRYRKGELIICKDGFDLEHDDPEYAKQVFDYNHWSGTAGKSLVVTTDERENLFKGIGMSGKARTIDTVDVKNLLEMGRIIIEKSALDQILEEHQSDLISKVRRAV